MRFRTFVSVLVLLGLAAGVVFLLRPNRVVLEQPVDVLGRSIPVWGLVLGALALGILITLSFLVSGLGRKAVERAFFLYSSRHRQAAGRALERGKQAELDEREEDAIGAFREAADKAPDDYESHMRLGNALRRSGRHAEAVLAHDRARRLEPDADEPLHALALDQLAAGRVDDARRTLTRLVDRNPRSAVGPLRRLRDLEIRAGNWSAASRAQRRLEALFTRSRQVPETDRRQGLGIRTELARSRALAGQSRSSFALLRRVRRDAAPCLPGGERLAALLAEAGEHDEAKELLQEGFLLTGEPALLEALAELDLERERPEDAISTLRGIVASRRWPAAARLALGQLYSRLEMLDEAAVPFEDLLDTQGETPYVQFLLAQVEERRGNIHRAAHLYRTVLQGGDRSVPGAFCRECRAELPHWVPLCSSCGAFGAVTTRTSPDEITLTGRIASAPVYPASEG